LLYSYPPLDNYGERGVIVGCPKCKRKFDDEFRTTICPHPTFAANDGKNNLKHHKDSYISPELDTALDEFVADRPKSIIKDT
jgi:hypothetical protein